MHWLYIYTINQYKCLLLFNKLYIKIKFNMKYLTKSKCEWKEQFKSHPGLTTSEAFSNS